jgi:hypothetical protein
MFQDGATVVVAPDCGLKCLQRGVGEGPGVKIVRRAIKRRSITAGLIGTSTLEWAA